MAAKSKHFYFRAVNPADLAARPSMNLSEDWMVLIFLAVFCAVAMAVVTSPRYFTRMVSTLMNVRIMRQVMREEITSRRQNLVFDVVFFFILGTLVYLGSKAFDCGDLFAGRPGFSRFLLGTAGVTGMYFIKLVSISAVQYLAGRDPGLREYRYNVLLTNRALGLVLFPLVLFAAYSGQGHAANWLQGALVVMSLFLIYRTGRGMMGALEQGIPLLYIIFYICTLEILPLLLFFRWLGLV